MMKEAINKIKLLFNHKIIDTPKRHYICHGQTTICLDVI